MAENLRGRKPGLPAQKRKAEDELSTNPNTKKARERMKNLSEDRARFEKARKALATAQSREQTRIKQLTIYTNASEQEQQAMLEQGRRAIEAKYMANKRHPSFFQTLSGLDVQELVDRTQLEDGDPAYEDITDLDEVDIAEVENINRVLNGEPQPRVYTNEEIKELEQKKAKANEKAVLKQVFSILRKAILNTMGSMEFKIRMMRNEPSTCRNIAVAVVKEWQATTDQPLPKLAEHIFTPSEMFIWFLLQKVSSTTLNKFLLPSKKCQRSFPRRKWSVLHIGHRNKSYHWAPTVISLVKEIRGWGYYNRGLPKTSQWETLPGPSWIWGPDNLLTLSVVYPHYENFVGLKLDVLKAIFDEGMTKKEKVKFIAFSRHWYELFSFSMTS